LRREAIDMSTPRSAFGLRGFERKYVELRRNQTDPRQLLHASGLILHKIVF
jgi:hypothetical protein